MFTITAAELRNISAPDETYNDLVRPRTFTNTSVRESYRTGGGDTPVFIRPGALDFKDKPSKGLQ